MPNQTKHDFRGITTTRRVEPARTPVPTEIWQVSANGLMHILYPASPASCFKMIICITSDESCFVSLRPKDGTEWVIMGANFWVEDTKTKTGLDEMRRKAKTIAQRLLKRQAALL